MVLISDISRSMSAHPMRLVNQTALLNLKRMTQSPKASSRTLCTTTSLSRSAYDACGVCTAGSLNPARRLNSLGYGILGFLSVLAWQSPLRHPKRRQLALQCPLLIQKTERPGEEVMAGSDAADVRYGMHASHDRQGVSIIRTCML